MSLPDSASNRPRGVLVRKPKTSIYTVLLGVTIGALAIGCLALALEIMRYGWLLDAWKIPSNLK